jgi:S-adenosylmethionine/arginine decarboxylase-like enzyme
MKTPRLQTVQIDLYDCTKLPRTVEDTNDFLTNLVAFVGMRIIPENIIGNGNPYSFYFDVKKLCLPDIEAGITGTVTLFESHAAIHTWFDMDFACVVLTSCKQYIPDAVAEFCRKYFGANIWEIS